MEASQKKKGKTPNRLADTVFSWLFDDVLKNKVEKIPDSFHSVEHYFGRYLYPLFEETRAHVHSSMETIHRAPYAKVVSFENAKPCGRKLYNVKADHWRNRFNDRSKEPYKTMPGDLFVLANAKPETVSDLQRVGRSWAFGSVTNVLDSVNKDDTASFDFKVEASIELEALKSTTPLFMVFLENLMEVLPTDSVAHKILFYVSAEKSRVSESLLRMKSSYSLPSGVVNHLLSDHEGMELDLPFEVTVQEMEIILYRRSSSIVGRSGTGKTTALTMKLSPKDQWHQLAVQGCQLSESSKAEYSSAATEGKVLHQLFVTVRPKLCYAIKQHVLHWKRFAFASHSTETHFIDMSDFDEDEAQFNDLQDSFYEDVLLYNFFDSSPSRNQWRVIYDYMKELDLLDHTLPRVFPSFDVAKHNILCSELKLYVAVTRTRQRLWICENFEELSKPKRDDSLSASSPEEWKSRGMKLYYEHNYEMATMCFERAGDSYWERSKAVGLKAFADHIVTGLTFHKTTRAALALTLLSQPLTRANTWLEQPKES